MQWAVDHRVWRVGCKPTGRPEIVSVRMPRPITSIEGFSRSHLLRLDFACVGVELPA